MSFIIISTRILYTPTQGQGEFYCDDSALGPWHIKGCAECS